MINRNLVLTGIIIFIVVFSYKIFSVNALMDARRIDGIVEPVYTQDCFPRTLERIGVTKKCFERANLGQNIFCTKSEVSIIEDYYKIGQNKDPLNGTKDFCAE